MSPSFKFFIDENMSHRIVAPLQAIFPTHKFRSAEQEQLRSIQDTILFKDLWDRDFHAIITGDNRQMIVPDELKSLISHKLHWIYCHPANRSGIAQIASQVATITMGMPFILANWGKEPTGYELKAPGGTEPVNWTLGEEHTFR